MDSNTNAAKRKRRPKMQFDDDDGTTPTRRASDRWHVGKEIPIVLIVGLLAQTAGGIWWMSQMAAKIDSAVSTIAEFRSERYTREDARRDRELLESKFTAGQTADRELDRRISTLESRIDRVERSH